MENKRTLNSKETATVVVLTTLPNQILSKTKVESIKGSQGMKGSPGYPGVQGHKGYPGDQGYQGNDSQVHGRDGENIYLKEYIYASESLELNTEHNNYQVFCGNPITITYSLNSITIPFISFISTHSYEITIVLPATATQTLSTYTIPSGSKVLICYIPEQDKWYKFEG